MLKEFESFSKWNLVRLRDILSEAQGPIAVGEILSETTESGERAEVLRQLMWLLKYGYLRIVPGNTTNTFVKGIS